MTTRQVMVGAAGATVLAGMVVLGGDAWAHPWHRHADTAADTTPAAERSDRDEAYAGEQEHAHPGPLADSPGGESGVQKVFVLTADRAQRASDATPTIAKTFAAFERRGEIVCRQDDRWFFVESNGIPNHPLMVGIRTWQQQVPLPQPYVGKNAWQIPLHPVPAVNPQSARNAFLRGAIAVAANGIPIFNPLNNRGEDASAIGELDTFGGHCGRADDYHYHLPPVHLQDQVGKGMPIAYALDGYPVYGFSEPDGSPPEGLDIFNGHETPGLGYHYHATKTYPYLNGGFHGEVVEKDGQVDPQPRAQPVRVARPPLPGASIVAFESPAPDKRLLTYEIDGRKGTVDYARSDDGSVAFVYTAPSGEISREEVRPRQGGGGGGQGGRPENRGGGQRSGGQRQPMNRPAGRSAGGPQGGQAAAPRSSTELRLISSAVAADGTLAAEFTCDGEGISPPVSWSGAPQGTASVALSLWHESPDGVKSYWVVHGIPSTVTGLPKGAKGIGVEGLNGRRRVGYDPMCSQGPGAKTYHLTVYALSSAARLSTEPLTRDGLLTAIEGTVLAQGELTFTYTR
jgi:phosphatidylethanolamine-binding protein (PEBP) family uncharacterized protein